MLSKEEIEKAKGICKLLCGEKTKKGKREYKTFARMQMQIDYTVDEMAEAIETLLQYIDQLEQYLEKISKQLDNVAIGQIPIGIAELQQKNESAYWKGYIQKQNEAMEICKMCKYRKQYFEKKVEEK